jgi:hypothetical protein
MGFTNYINSIGKYFRAKPESSIAYTPVSDGFRTFQKGFGQTKSHYDSLVDQLSAVPIVGETLKDIGDFSLVSEIFSVFDLAGEAFGVGASILERSGFEKAVISPILHQFYDHIGADPRVQQREIAKFQSGLQGIGPDQRTLKALEEVAGSLKSVGTFSAFKSVSQIVPMGVPQSQLTATF